MEFQTLMSSQQSARAIEGTTFGNFGVCDEGCIGVGYMVVRDFEMRMILLDSIQDVYWFAKWKNKEQMGKVGIR